MGYGDRRQIERDLNDVVEQPLVLVALKLAMAQRLIESDPPAAAALVDETRADLDLEAAVYFFCLEALEEVVGESVGGSAVVRVVGRNNVIESEVRSAGSRISRSWPV